MTPQSRPTGRQEGEGGVATVWAVYWMFVLASVGMLALLAAMITATQHHLAGAADLASLSAAARLQRGGDACRSADDIARRNGVQLTRCEVSGDDVEVTVSDTMALPFGLDGSMSQSSRAGP